MFALGTIPALTGCLGLYQPKSYVEVTKPPFRVIYIDYHRDVSPDDVDRIMNNMKNVKYHPYRFNDSNDIDIRYNASLKTAHSKSIEVRK